MSPAKNNKKNEVHTLYEDLIFAPASGSRRSCLGAFSGLVNINSTNFSGIDWDKTFREFEAGRISTGR